LDPYFAQKLKQSCQVVSLAPVAIKDRLTTPKKELRFVLHAKLQSSCERNHGSRSEERDKNMRTTHQSTIVNLQLPNTIDLKRQTKATQLFDKYRRQKIFRQRPSICRKPPIYQDIEPIKMTRLTPVNRLKPLHVQTKDQSAGLGLSTALNTENSRITYELEENSRLSNEIRGSLSVEQTPEAIKETTETELDEQLLQQAFDKLGT
jgi:hypothetical protein